MSEHHDDRGRFKPGNRAGIAGRPRGIVEKRRRITKALLNDAETIARVVSAAAQGGDLTAAAMVIDRAVPALKREGALVKFTFDPAASLTDQFNDLMAAVASGQLTVEEGQKLADMLRTRAEIAATEGRDAHAERLIASFKDLATKVPV